MAVRADASDAGRTGVNGTAFLKLARALPGVTEVAHFERTAFKAKRIFASLAKDQLTANVLLSWEDQQLHQSIDGAAFRPLPNSYGAKGWTEITLAATSPGDLQAVLAKALVEGERR